MISPNLSIDITAVDETASGVKSARKNLGSIGNVVQGVHKNLKDAVKGSASFADLNKNLNASFKSSGANSLLGGLNKIRGGGSILDLGKGLAEAAEGAEALAGSMGVLALGIGGVTAAAGAAAVAAYKFTKPWVSGAANIGQLSLALGIATRDLQTFEGAAARVGVSKDNADAALGGLASSAHAALYSPGGGEQRAVFGALGIDYHKFADRSGKVDLPNLLAAVADGIARQGNAQSAAHVAQSLGVSSALPLLRQGSGYLRSNMRSVASFGYYSDTDVQRALQGAQDDVINGQFVDRSVRRARGAVAKHGVLQGMDALAGLASAGVGAPQSQAPSLLGGPIDRTPAHRILLMPGIGLQAPVAPVLSGPAIAGGLSSALPSVAFGNVVQTKFAPAADKLNAGAAALQALAETVHTSGMRRNNPGNLRPLRGGGFNSYESAGEGLNAMGRLLRIYEHRHGLSTIEGIINRYAPPSDHNPTEAYKNNVARRTGLARNQRLDLDNDNVLASLMGAMIAQEQGRNPFSSAQIAGALKQAPPSALHVTVSVEDHRVRARVRHDHPRGMAIHYDSTGRG